MSLLTTIGQVGIFIICAQTVAHFRPNESYEKYMKLLVSVMVLVQLVMPLANVFRKGSMELLQESITNYEISMQEEMEKINITSVMAEEERERMAEKEILERMEQAAVQEGVQTEEEGQETGSQTSQGGQTSQGSSTSLGEGGVKLVDAVRIEVGGNE